MNFLGSLGKLGNVVSGYEDYQKKQQDQAYRNALVQLERQRMAQEAQRFGLQQQQLQQEQRALGAAWPAMLGGGMGQGQPGAPPSPMMGGGGLSLTQPPQAQAQPLPRPPMAPPGMAGGGAGMGTSGPGRMPMSRDGLDYPFPTLQNPNPPAPKFVQNFAGQPNAGDASIYGPGSPYGSAPPPGAARAAAGAQQPGPINQEAQQTAQQVTQAVPPQQWGRSSVKDLAQAIEQTNPDASPQVKMMALANLTKLLAPQERMELQMMMQQNRGLIQEEIARLRTDTQRDIAGARESGLDRRVQLLEEGREHRQEVGEAGKDTRQQKRLEQTQPSGNVEQVAQGIANYQISPLSGWAMRGAWGQQVMSRVMEINPEYKATEYAARTSGARAFATGRQSDTVRSMSVAMDHLSTLRQLGEALQNNDARRLNQVKNLLQTELGYEGPVDFNAAKMIVSDEVTKAVAGGVLSMTERLALGEQINAASSPEQLNGVIGTLQKLLGGQLGGLRRQYQSATGKSSEEFDQLLSPAAKALGGGQPAPTGGGYTVGQVINKGGKQYRVTGGDPNDPDVEEVK